MEVHLSQKENGQWQADIVLPDGSDHHAIGRNFGEALIELGIYLEKVRPPSDIETLARVCSGL